MENSKMSYKIIIAIVVVVIVGVGIYAYTRSAQAPTNTTATTTPTADTTGTPSNSGPAPVGATHSTPAQMASNDATIKSELATVVTDAAGYFNAHTRSYGTDVHNSCANAVSGTTVFSYPSVRAALVSIIAHGGAQQVCEVYGGGSSFAVSVQTTSNPAQWYCVDSSGFKGTTTGNSLATTDAGCK